MPNKDRYIAGYYRSKLEKVTRIAGCRKRVDTHGEPITHNAIGILLL